MFERFSTFHPVLQALLATCFTWLMTALGAAVVFWRRDMSRKVLDWMLGFAVMMDLDVALGLGVLLFFVDWREPFPVPCDESKHHRRGRNIQWHK